MAEIASFLGNVWFALLLGVVGYCLGNVWPLRRIFPD